MLQWLSSPLNAIFDESFENHILFMPVSVTVFLSVTHLKYSIHNDSSHIMNSTGVCRLLELGSLNSETF